MPFQLAIPLLDRIVEGPWWVVLMRCLFICPIIPMLIAPVLESRWLPLNPLKTQFWAFFPGNPALAGFIAAGSTLTAVPSTTGIWQTTGMQWIMFASAIVIYLFLTFKLDRDVYRPDQMKSPTKVYHNLLYSWYGYLGAAMFVVVISASIDPAERFLKLLPGLFWLGCLVKDNFTSKEKLAVKFQTAHANWCVIWKHWQFRRLIPLRLTENPVYVYAFPGSTEVWPPDAMKAAA